MINQVVQNSGWLLDEIRQYTAPSALSEDMNKTLKSFQKYVVSNCHYQEGDSIRIITLGSSKSFERS